LEKRSENGIGIV